MLTINRNCSYRIITRAVQLESEALIGLLQPGASDIEVYQDINLMQQELEQSPDAIVVYNQQNQALALIDRLSTPNDQIFIEIRQDTKGVLGLHAIRHRDKTPETLELIYQ
ncbi:MAG: hypothetical protein AAF353_05570 [Pseudomonadota bacterium]